MGVSDKDTIASNLQRLINSHNLDSHKSYCVFNCANHAGTNLDLQFDLINTMKFNDNDIIISTVRLGKMINFMKKYFITLDCQPNFERPHDMGEVFIDRAHINKIGNQKIAELLFQTMLDNKLFDKQADKPSKDVNDKREAEIVTPASGLTMTQNVNIEAPKVQRAKITPPPPDNSQRRERTSLEIQRAAT
jgi:hypothetical protein